MSISTDFTKKINTTQQLSLSFWLFIFWIKTTTICNMLTSDIRRQNARALAGSVGSPAEFGRKTGMPDSQISQLIGENPTKNIGGIIARRIEEAFKKPNGWMDVLHVDVESEDHPIEAEKPLTETVTVEEILELITLYKDAPADDREMIMQTARLNQRRRKLLASADR